MKVTKKYGHQDMCGGYSYVYNIELCTENATLKDALNEIKLWQKESLNKGAYGIYANGSIIESTWAGEQPENEGKTWKSFYHGDMTEKVIEITGRGGWYCGIDFDIKIEPKVKKSKIDYYLSQFVF